MWVLSLILGLVSVRKKRANLPLLNKHQKIRLKPSWEHQQDFYDPKTLYVKVTHGPPSGYFFNLWHAFKKYDFSKLKTCDSSIYTALNMSTLTWDLGLQSSRCIQQRSYVWERSCIPGALCFDVAGIRKEKWSSKTISTQSGYIKKTKQKTV